MTADNLTNTADELEEMGFEILNILEDMERLVRSTRSVDSSIHNRADVYWIAHVRQALQGPGMVTLRDTVKEIREAAEYEFAG